MQKKTFILLLLPLAILIFFGLIAYIILLFPVSASEKNVINSKALQLPHSQREAFSKPSKQVTRDQKMNFLIGKAMFKKLWVSSPASTKSSDGLGPLFNARSCLSCHPKNGRGRPTEKDKISQSLFLQLSTPAPSKAFHRAMLEGRKDHFPAPIYGSQLQNRAVQGHAGEGDVHISYVPKTVVLKGGEKVVLQQPVYKIKQWGYGQASPNLQTSPRLAPQMIGLGLLEAIPEADILKNADPEDKNQDGISGKASKVWSFVTKNVMLGRFGWKASTPSVLEQSSRALSSDMGISNPIFKAVSGDCTSSQKKCQNAPHGNSPYGGVKENESFEINKKVNDDLAFYAAHLGVPKPRLEPKNAIAKGKNIFNVIGCAACHIPKFKIASSKTPIAPYSDLLLHDMGEGLADHRPVHNATGSEWRTAPLWGIGLSEAVNGNGYFLHDGRARSVKEAILWHGGEAKRARTMFMQLTKQNRDRLLAFVQSR